MTPGPAALGQTRVLYWREAPIGCLTLLLLLAAPFFGFAALDLSFAAKLAERPDGALIALTNAMTLGGINVPLALLSLYLFWVFLIGIWRLSDRVAITATPDALIPHRSTFVRPLGWRDVEELAWKPGPSRGFLHVAQPPWLVVRLRDGRRRTFRSLESDERARADFTAFAEQAIAAARSGAAEA